MTKTMLNLSLMCVHYFFYEESNQYAAAYNANTKQLLDTFLDNKIIRKIFSTLWEYMDGCYEPYRSTYVLYLLFIVAYAYEIIIASAVCAPGNEKLLWMVSTSLKKII